MTWIAISDFQEPAYWKPAKSHGAAPIDDGLLTTGTLLIELEYEPRAKDGHRLVHYHCDQGWRREIRLDVRNAHEVCLTIRQGARKSETSLSGLDLSPGSRIRICYAWDAPNRTAQLTVQNLDTETQKTTNTDDPMPWPLADAKGLFRNGQGCGVDPSVSMMALSDEMTCVGTAPTIAAGMLIETSDGPRQIERLQLGDEVLTHDRGFQAIRWITKCTVPAKGFFAPRVLRAPYFGLTRDIVVAPQQRILMTGITSEYIFGHDGVLAEVRHLKQHPSVRFKLGQRTMDYYQIVLDNHECIQVSGLWCASAFVDPRSGYESILDASGIQKMSDAALPQHDVCRPFLEGYETSTLLAANCA